MSFQFTPAADRALQAAATWDEPDSGSDVTSAALLLGLLEQSECRAAKVLQRQGIDVAAVETLRSGIRRRGLEEVAGLGRAFLSREVEDGLRAALAVLDESPRTCQIATEHMLLGLALSEDSTGAWLREQGIDPAALEAEICARYGINHEPIPFEWVDPPIPLAEPVETSAAVESGPKFDIERRTGLVRVLDAAANRAGEALRVVEDYARFLLDDAGLTRQCKEFRHDLNAALAVVPQSERLAGRNTTHDVGTGISTESEQRRSGVDDVVGANLRRLQESLRTLEEFGKVFDPGFGRACEQLRYRAYTLQKTFAERAGSAVALASPLRQRLAAAKLYVLVDGRDSEQAFVKLVEQLTIAGADVLQLRDKQLDDRTLLSRARLLRRATRDTSTLFIMNDRPDLAALAAADGVHVGQDELSVAEARLFVGADRLVGVSAHSIEQARQAVADGADYIGVGPTFPSGTKQFDAFPGLELVGAVAREITLPAFVIGGITVDNVSQVRQSGLRRVAAGGAVLQADDPAAVVGRLKHALS